MNKFLMVGLLVSCLGLAGCYDGSSGQARGDEDLLRRGIQYYTGEAGWRDRKKARPLFKKAMEKGDPRAGLMYARTMLENPARTVDEVERAKELKAKYRPKVKTLAEKGDSYAMAVFGTLDSLERAEKGSLLEEAAREGIALAQYELGLLYDRSFSDKKYGEIVIYWLAEAAKQGHAMAARKLAEHYNEGWLVDRDTEQAARLYEYAYGRGCYLYPNPYLTYSARWQQPHLGTDFRKALQLLKEGANRGDPSYEKAVALVHNLQPIHDCERAQYWLERAARHSDSYRLALFLIGSSCPSDFERARLIFEELLASDTWRYAESEVGSDRVSIRRYLGYIYLSQETNLHRAFEYLSAGDAPDSVTTTILKSYCYIYGKGVDRDMSRAQKYFDKAIFRRGQKEGALRAPALVFELGAAFLWQRPQSESWLRKVVQPLAARGGGQASYIMGYLLETAVGEKKDMAGAVEHYTRAAEKGVSYAQLRLGLCYLEGRGTSKNRQKAEKWLRRAITESDSSAIKNYARGMLCYHGVDREQDQSKAAALFEEAIENGQLYGPALLMLGDLYAAGKGGLKQDLVRARELYERGLNFTALMKAVRFWENGMGCEKNIYQAARCYEMALGLKESEKAKGKLEELRAEYRRRYPDPVIPLPEEEK